MVGYEMLAQAQRDLTAEQVSNCFNYWAKLRFALGTEQRVVKTHLNGFIAKMLS